MIRLNGKVLITGGSGFLGRGIIRRALAENWDCQFVIYSRDEYKQDLCRQKYIGADITYILGDIRDTERLYLSMLGCSSVIHTAALKYVPEAENNVTECISVNIEGTESVIEAARRANVSNVVGISTDKAVQPVNIYGMTKAVMEKLFVEASRYRDEQKFTMVRYGNVIGSTGSVIPVFKRQLEKDGCIKVTDPDMTRYWITINEAIDLIMWAMLAQNGSIIIPKTSSMHMEGLAFMLAGGKPVNVIGVRPGEKKHEQLLHMQESVRAQDMKEFYELHRGGQHSEPFALSSDMPEKHMDRDVMLNAIADAELV